VGSKECVQERLIGFSKQTERRGKGVNELELIEEGITKQGYLKR
jgi:hypothetical protein